MQIHSEYHGYFLAECIKQHQDGTVYIGQGGEEAAPELVIKIFNTQLISLRDRQRFLQEVNVLTSLRHPALLPFLEIGLDKGNPYLIREYAPGGSLITQLLQQDGLAFSLPTVMAILTRIGAAIAYLHQEQVSHGSVKPENILFDINKQAFLADIHIASIHPDIPSTVYEPVLTDKGLMLWEQPVLTQDDRESKMQADIYALGSIAYELLTRYQPFTSDGERDVAPVPPSHWMPSLPQKVDQVFLQALSPQPEERFSSATLFVEALQSALDPSISIKEQDTSFSEQQVTPQPSVEQRQLVPFQPPAELQRPISTQRPIMLQLHSFGRDLLEVLAILKSQLLIRQKQLFRSRVFGREQAGINVVPIRLLLIIFAVLLVLISILVPIFLFHLHSTPTTIPHAPNQTLTRHTTSIATRQPGRTATHVNNQRRASAAISIPTPKSRPTPVPMPTIVNAGFEAPILNGDYEYAPNYPGWTFSNDCGIASNGSNLTQGTDNAPRGTQVAFIQAYGTMNQNVSFAQGTYRVSFLAAQRVSSSSTQSLWVLIDNTVVGSFTPVGGNYLYYTTPSFTVSPGIHTLQFKGLNGGAHNTVFIDSVTIVNG